MDRKTLFTSIENGKFEQIYLFAGLEAHIRREAEKKLVDKLMPPGLDTLNMNVLSNPDVQQIKESCETMPFLAERRLVIVRELSLLGKAGNDNKKAEGKTEEKSSGREVDDLIAYLGKLPETTCLLIDGGEGIDKRKKLSKFLTGLEGFVEFLPLDDQELAKWIRQQVKRNGNTIRPETIERLVFLSGRDLTILGGEIGKLTALAGEGNEITIEHVDEIVVRTSEAQVFEMIDALLDGKTDVAMRMSNQLLQSGEGRIGILALITRQMRQMFYAAVMKQERKPSQEIAKALGVPSFIVGKILTRAGRYTTEKLGELLTMCVKADYDIKSGKVREESSYEQLLLSLTLASDRYKRK
ncbi:MAG: DNA polymerase III subunit delta [Clostridia bacterium]|nr:DNA polymerase III subunit delta [Clostridia bacterium]